jgi:hypothetical protein
MLTVRRPRRAITKIDLVCTAFLIGVVACAAFHTFRTGTIGQTLSTEGEAEAAVRQELQGPWSSDETEEIEIVVQNVVQSSLEKVLVNSTDGDVFVQEVRSAFRQWWGEAGSVQTVSGRTELTALLLKPGEKAHLTVERVRRLDGTRVIRKVTFGS